MSSGADEVRNCFCLHARRAARQLTQFYDRRLSPSGLRVTQFQLLAAISEAESITLLPLADLMGMDRTTLTRNLAILQRDSLVEIELGRRDRREHHFRLTDAGCKVVAAALPLWRSAQKQLAGRLKTGKSVPVHNNIIQLLDALSTLAAKSSD